MIEFAINFFFNTIPTEIANLIQLGFEHPIITLVIIIILFMLKPFLKWIQGDI